MSINLQTLKTELLTDPNGYGYAALIADTNNPALADMLNLPRAVITVRRTSIQPQDVLECIDTRDIKANPSNMDCAWFESATRQTTINLLDGAGADTQILGNFKRLLINPSDSRARLLAICNRNGSRIEQLFGVGVVVSVQEVIDAQRV